MKKTKLNLHFGLFTRMLTDYLIESERYKWSYISLARVGTGNVETAKKSAKKPKKLFH